MEEFNLVATQTTPCIKGSLKDGKVSICGKCCPEDSVAFFEPFYQWLKILSISENQMLEFEFDLKYMNTSSGLIIFRILKEIKKLTSHKKVIVTWKYDEQDEDMMGVGKDFQYMIGDIVKLKSRIAKAT